MAHQHSHPHAPIKSKGRSFGLAQMSAPARLALVVPAIALIWLVLWLLVRS
jgi:hypothetical protein